MLMPERMAKVSIVCLQKDLDRALNAIGEFGSFHVEYSDELGDKHQRRVIESLERTYATVNTIIKNLRIKEPNLILLKPPKKEKLKIYVENWTSLAENLQEEISRIEKEVNEKLNALKEIDLKIADLKERAKVLELIDRFNIEPKVIAELHLIRVFIAIVSAGHIVSIVRAFSNLPIIYHFEKISGKRSFLFVAAMLKDSQIVRKILETYDAEILSILKDVKRKPSEELSYIQQQLDEEYARREKITKEIYKFSEKYGDRLLSLREALLNAERFLKTKYAVQKSEHLALIAGYVPKSYIRNLRYHLDRELKGRFIIFSDGQAVDDPPTFLRNPRFIKSFEIITKLYGLPNYDEIDPTPFIAFTFPLIFGLMFGDLGHGLILFLGSLLFYFVVKSPEEWRRFSEILAACGLGSIIAGILFGEAFGKHMFKPLWMNPYENIVSFLVFSVFIGIMHIILGLILKMINFVIRRDYLDAFTVSLPAIIFYGVTMFFLMSCKFNFDLWFSGPIYIVAVAFMSLIFGKPVVLMLLGANDFLSVLGERIFEGGELSLSFLSNTASYTRILALLMTHWGLLKSVYALSGLASALPIVGKILETIMIAGGNIFVIAFEGLIVFIHTLRLHFYEWFSKFYDGTGTEFQPLKYEQNLIKIVYSGVK